MLSKYEEIYLNIYFQIAKVISEFSVCLLRCNKYTSMYASLNVKVVPVRHFKSLQLASFAYKNIKCSLIIDISRTNH